ncbi:trihelix transcription factor PTL-like [Hibiscus syriacus]|uniref:trihelix transcription factor PTL-like n=1 Tax=Hibiscus syriacus TaxID=106335 RepID=UPI00192125E3|nr:trihelix transcription factor PTL-like [Hibiscus syriacus]
MEMGDQYGLPDLRRLLTRRTNFPATLPPSSESYLAHRDVAQSVPYHDAAAYMLSNGIAMPSGLLRFSTATAFTASTSASAGGGGWSVGNCDGGNSRWPRQETLTLLEIRSRLDPKFKEANLKGPLWDEVSRIMGEEYGYLRSGKKCREKFENLYKYYKKTKDGKGGRQDGKNYRFFKQLEAIYGETSNPQTSVPETNINDNVPLQESMQQQKISDTLSLSESEFDDSSSGNFDDGPRVKKGSWKTKKVEEFVDSQMKKLIHLQDVWMERMLKVIQEKEQERVLKEEEWRRREATRFDREHEFWVKEKGWIEARDAALMAAVRKLSKTQNEINTNEHEISTWERRFQEIEEKMVSLGYERGASNAECYKKSKEDYFQRLDSIVDGQENKSFHGVKQRVERAAMDSSSSPSSSYDINSFHISAVNEWDRYGLKTMSKGKNQQI